MLGILVSGLEKDDRCTDRQTDGEADGRKKFCISLLAVVQKNKKARNKQTR